MLLANSNLHYRSKSQLAYSAIREAIIAGSLKPGERLVLSHLAEELGISEIPVREAIKKLEAEGLVLKSGAIFLVPKLSKLEIEENYVIRSTLEVAATRLAAEVIDDIVLSQLEVIVGQMAECLKSENFVEYGELNHRFHLMIYAQSPYRGLYQMINDLWENAQRTRAIFALRSQTSLDSHNEHLELLVALNARKVTLAEAIMRRHTDRTLAIIKSLILDEMGEK